MTLQENHLPDLQKLNQRMALDGARVQAILARLSPRLDALQQATREQNWSEVGRISHFLHRSCDVYGYVELAQKAGEVCEAQAACESPGELSRKVIGLMGAFAHLSSQAEVAQPGK